MLRLSIVCPLIAALACALWATPAHAVERQHHVGLAPAFGLLKAREQSVQLGFGGSALYRYGLTDQFDLHAEFTHQQFLLPKAAEGAPMNRPGAATSAAVGVSYVLDVLRWVPYAGLLLSGAALHGGELSGVLWTPAVELAVGLDYQLSRRWVVGAAYRHRFYFLRLNALPPSSALGIKIEWQWGP